MFQKNDKVFMSQEGRRDDSLRRFLSGAYGVFMEHNQPSHIYVKNRVGQCRSFPVRFFEPVTLSVGDEVDCVTSVDHVKKFFEGKKRVVISCICSYGYSIEDEAKSKVAVYPNEIAKKQQRFLGFKIGEFMPLEEAMNIAKNGDVLVNRAGQRYYFYQGTLFYDVDNTEPAVINKYILGNCYRITKPDALNGYIAVATANGHENAEGLCKDAYNIAIMDILATDRSEKSIKDLWRIC